MIDRQKTDTQARQWFDQLWAQGDPWDLEANPYERAKYDAQFALLHADRGPGRRYGRALEIGCEVLLMAKAVDGVFDSDPRENPDAELFSEISPREVIERGLKVADATAFSLCMDNSLPIVVFDINTAGGIVRAVRGEKIGTLVS